MNEREAPTGRSHANGEAEDATIYTEIRMLQDQTGRLRRYHFTFTFLIAAI